MEDWAEIRRLHRSEGIPIKMIARQLGCSKNTVRAALRRDVPPRYERPKRGSLVDAVEPRICELLAATPTMPATVIAERIDWSFSITILKETTTLASKGTGGPGNFASAFGGGAAISGDDRHVAVDSYASNFVEGGTNASGEVFLWSGVE